MRRAGTLTVVSLLALIAGARYAAVDVAAAPSCSSKVTITGPNSGRLILTPTAAKVQVGDCLAFTNSTSATVNIAITKDAATVFTATVAKGATTSVKGSYAPKTVGRAAIAASSHVLLLKLTGSGSATVSPAPSQSPSDSPSPHGHQSSKPSNRPSGSANPHKSSKSDSPTPHATGFKLPPLPPLPSVGQSVLPRGSSPVVAPGLTSLAPVTTDSSTPVAAVVAGPLETVENTSRGLPIAVAVLVVLGLASGYGRVLLASPRPATKRSGHAVDKRHDGSVDKRRDGDHRV